MAFRSGISGNPGGKLRRMADAAGVRPVAAPPVGTVGLQNRFAGMMSSRSLFTWLFWFRLCLALFYRSPASACGGSHEN